MRQRWLLVLGVVVVGLWALLSPPVGAQQDVPGGLFTAAATPPGAVPEDAPRTPSVLRSRLVTFDATKLFRQGSEPLVAAGPLLVLNLFPDVVVNAEFDKIVVGTEGFATWVGHVVGDPLRPVTLTARGDVMSGVVVTRERSFEIRPRAGGLTLIIEVDRSIRRPGDGRDAIAPEEPSPNRADPAPHVDGGSTFDALFLFTPAARRVMGRGDFVVAEINAMVAQANVAYENSSMLQRMNLVGIRDVEYTETAVSDTDLSRLRGRADGFMDEVHAIRSGVGADVVQLLVGPPTYDVCGLAYGMDQGDNTTAFAVSAFSVVDIGNGCGSSFTSTHEFGHIMGANHAPDDPGGTTRPVFPYAFGFKDLPGAFRSIMAYKCAGPGDTCPVGLYFSNPNVSRNGRATGTPTQHNARTLDNTVSTVSSFGRRANGTLPGMPGTPTFNASGPTLNWTAPTFGTPPDRYVLEYSEFPGMLPFGTVDLGLTTAFNVGGAPAGVYFIRIRAVNAFGSGASSDTLALRLEPPAAPTGLTAAASGNSVAFNWTAPTGGGPVLGYLLAAAGSAGATTVTLPSVTTSTSAVGPDGTWFARVHAANNWGVSGPSNEVSFRLGTDPPGPPTNLGAIIRQNRVDLAWSAPTTGGPVAAYILEAGSTSGASNLFNGSVGPVLGTQVPHVANGRYFVRVRARNAAGTSAPSNEIVIVPDGGTCTGDISATLTWNTATDIDLHVIEPNGTHVYYARRTGTTAVLDRDNTSGFGPENICVSAGRAAPGFYEVFVVYFSGAPVTTATITVRTKAGTPTEKVQAFTRTLSSANTRLGIKVAAVDGVGNQIVEHTGTLVPPGLATTLSTAGGDDKPKR